MRFFFTFSLLVAGASFADGSLSSDIRISSAALGYDLQYRVYIPGDVESAEELPALFITDGPAYIRHGGHERPFSSPTYSFCGTSGK